MVNQDTGFVMDSKEDIDKRAGSITPIEAEDYIVKLAKVDLLQKPQYTGSGWNYSKLDWVFECLCMVQGLKAGGDMTDIEGGSVEPFSRYIFREVNPKSTGFMPDQVTPSFLRAVVAYMEGTQINDSIKAPNFILLDSKNKEVTDAKLRKEFLEKMQSGDIMHGYTAIPDIRSYEGRYIGCAVEVIAKGDKKRNTISKFSKLPSNFAGVDADAENEAMKKFNTYYNEKLVPMRKKRMEDGLSTVGDMSQPVADDIGEVVIDDVSL